MAETASNQPCTLEVIDGWSLIQVASWRDRAAEVDRGLEEFFGRAPPAEVGAVSSSGPTTLLRMAPNRIWIVDDDGAALAELVEAIGIDVGCSMSLGEGRCRLRLSGSDVQDVLAKLVALNLDSPALSPGRAASTAMHRVPVLVHRLTRTVFDLYVPRTFEQSLTELIRDAAGITAR